MAGVFTGAGAANAILMRGNWGKSEATRPVADDSKLAATG